MYYKLKNYWGIIMSETITTEEKVAPKTEAKPTAVKAAPKTEAKPTAVKATPKAAAAQPAATKTKVAAPKKVAAATEATLTGIAEDQLDASAQTIINALTALDQQLQDARTAGSDRAQEIIREFGGENKLTDLISKLAGYMGEAAGAGMIAGMSPMLIMAGAAKGVYKKITN
jgi:hypothetical protein